MAPSPDPEKNLGKVEDLFYFFPVHFYNIFCVCVCLYLAKKKKTFSLFRFKKEIHFRDNPGCFHGFSPLPSSRQQWRNPIFLLQVRQLSLMNVFIMLAGIFSSSPKNKRIPPQKKHIFWNAHFLCSKWPRHLISLASTSKRCLCAEAQKEDDRNDGSIGYVWDAHGFLRWVVVIGRLIGAAQLSLAHASSNCVVLPFVIRFHVFKFLRNIPDWNSYISFWLDWIQQIVLFLFWFVFLCVACELFWNSCRRRLELCFSFVGLPLEACLSFNVFWQLVINKVWTG